MFVVVTLAIVLLALVFLYNAGKVTGEKMQLQNAADATAYSVSLIEARDLNFAAYTNRAMVANEVAIGQLVGLVSFAHHWKSIGPYLRAYDFSVFQRLTLSPPLPPVTTALITPFTNAVFDAPGTAMVNFTSTVARLGSQRLQRINQGYGYAQQVYHWASVAYAGATIDDMIERNAPGAKLSDFGWLALIAHTATYGQLPGMRGTFIKTYRSADPAAPPPTPGAPTASENAKGMERLAATVRASRDEFTKERGWDLEINIPPLLPFDEEFDVSFKISLGVLEITFFLHIELAFGLSADRFGASELRFTGTEAAGKRFGWSAADTTGVSVDFKVFFKSGVDVEVCLPGVGCVPFKPTPGVSIDVDISGGRANVIATIDPPGIDIPLVPNIPAPTSIPFSSGSAQAGSAVNGNFQNNASLVATMLDAPDSYGRAPTNLPAWSTGLPPVMVPSPSDFAAPPAVPVVSLTMPTIRHKLNTTEDTYAGLPQYLDTVDQDDPWGFQAPFLIVGVVKEMNKVTATGPRPSGRFELEDKAADEELGAIAKSEVYFKRPTDFDLFERADGQEEFGSAFNPYWSARLVDTSHAERVVSLWLQQDQAFGTVAGTLSLDEWNPLDWVTP